MTLRNKVLIAIALVAALAIVLYFNPAHSKDWLKYLFGFVTVTMFWNRHRWRPHHEDPEPEGPGEIEHSGSEPKSE